MSQPQTDPFDTASLRAAVLDAWRSSPTRFREDANVEEDYALGAYRDRLIVELAQNAADAARSAGVPGRILIRVADDGLVVANTGAPLDLAGVQSMAAMRASSKSSDAVGKFGVGFTAALSITDEPAVVSRKGSVRFSRDDSAELMREAGLAELVEARQPPALRLPIAYDRQPPAPYDTAVILPYRDETARAAAVEAIAAIDDALFIALPELVELVVESVAEGVEHRWTAAREDDLLIVEVDGDQRRWLLASDAGEWSEADRSGAPTEARGRHSWSLTWALPVTGDGAIAAWPDGEVASPSHVIHAPTPTDEPLGLAALLVADVPVDPSRRRLAEGPMTDVVLAAASARYVAMVGRFAAERGAAAVSLVPAPDLVGQVDARLRTEIREQLMRSAWIPHAADGALALPSELVAVEPNVPALAAVVAPHVPDLLGTDWLPYVPVLRGLGLSLRSWADVWDALAPRGLSATEWKQIYVAAAGVDRSALEGLPIPVADGRVLRDARACVMADGLAPESAEDLATLGLAVVDPDAADPLLERLGARPFDARQHLTETLIRRVAQTVDDDETEARAMVVAAASVLQATDVRPGDVVVLGEMLVPTQGEDWAPAAQVVLPDTPLSALVDRHLLLDAALASEHRDGWLAMGVLGELTVVTVSEIALEPEAWDRLTTDGGDWCEEVAELLDAQSPADLLAVSVPIVRGLEFVESVDAVRAIAMMSAPGVRAAVVEPAMVLDANGRTCAVRSPAALWLSELPLFDDRAPISVRLSGDERLAPFFPALADSDDLDVELLAAIGVHTTLEEWIKEPVGLEELLVAMADDELGLADDLVPELYAAIAASLSGSEELPAAPDRLRALVGGGWQVVDADEAVVAIAPHHAAVLTQPFVSGDESLADLFDIPVSDDARCGAADLSGTGTVHRTPDAVRGADIPSEYREHESLVIGGVEVDWWVTDDGEVHACTVEGVARALAWASGEWSRRWELAALLSEPDTDPRRGVESYYDG